MVEDVNNLPVMKQLLKWHGVMFTCQQAKTLVKRLRLFGPAHKVDALLELDALVAAFALTYGRMFASATGVAQLKPEIFEDGEQYETHEDLIDMRNRRYAHHAQHGSVDYKQEITELNGEYLIASSVRLELDPTLFNDWLELVEIAETYIQGRVRKFLEVASQQVGKTVRFARSDEEPQNVVITEYVVAHFPPRRRREED